MPISRFFKKLSTRAKSSTSNHSGLANNTTLSRFMYFSNNNIRKDFGIINRKNITTPNELAKEIKRRDIELKSKIKVLKNYISVLQDDANKTKDQSKKIQIENEISKSSDEYGKLLDIQHIFNSRWMQQENNKTTIKSSSKRSSTRSSKRSSTRSSKRSSKRRGSTLSLLNGLEKATV